MGTLKILNLAGTITLPQDIDVQKTALVHGAKYFLNWPTDYSSMNIPDWYPFSRRLDVEEAQIGIELVVTDWGEYDHLESLLKTILSKMSVSSTLQTTTSSTTTT